MKNCLIIGSGRSGTSMVAGTLAKAGYFMGNYPSQERESNPKGNFEDAEINRINENLLAQVVAKRPKLLGNFFFRHRPQMWQRWLAHVPVGKKISTSVNINQQIEFLTEKQPYCFKDPRFSYTLPVWRPYLKNTVFVCVFRDPGSTALSMIKLCQKAQYLSSLKLDFQQALKVWQLMYQHILEIHRYEGNWLFLHYQQAVTKNGLERLAKFTGAKVDYNFPDLSMSQSFARCSVNKDVSTLYQQLCELAFYK